MALITGSTTIDWSGVSLDPIDVQQDFNNFASRFNQAVSEITNGQFSLNSPNTSTFLSVTLGSGGIVTAMGSGLDLNNPASKPVVKSFEYSNTSTGDVVSLTGTLDFVGKEVVNSLTIGFPGSQQTIIGTILVDVSSGNASGTITQLQETLGSTEVTLKGSLVLSGNFDISGTVTQISVMEGTNTIVMSGLLLPYHALDSVATANDLFSVVGNLMSGNDTITYTNNSSVEMTFYGGAGNDTISISGPNGDTLNGGAGNDTLNGGAGDDTLNGGDGNDVILIGATAEHGVTEVIDGGAGIDVIRFSSTTPGQTLVLASGVTAVESVVIANAAGLTTGTTALDVDASAVGNGLSLIGNAGDNVLTGTSANDTLKGGAGTDTLNGGGGINTLSGGTGNDRFMVNSLTDVVSEALNAGTDEVVASLNYTLGANVENLTLTGSANVNGTGNVLANVLTGNSGDNLLSGLAGNDTLSGGAGQDTVDGSVGNDVIVMQVTTGDVDVAHGGTGIDTLVLSGTVPGDHVVVADLSVADHVVSIGGVADALVQDGFENLDASGLGSAVHATGSAGANILIGSLGDDTMNGGLGNDILTGGPGSDALNGGEGNDTYRLNLFDPFGGDDTITESGGTDTSVIVANGADLSGLNFEQSGAGLVASLLGTSMTTVDQYAGGGGKVESLRFEGGASFAGYGAGTASYLLNTDPGHTGGAQQDLIAGSSTNETLNGMGGNDLLFGNGDADTLNGGVGNDFLVGGAGQDTVDGSVGNDVIVMQVTTGDVDVAHGGTGIDTLVLSGVVPGDHVVVADLSVADHVVSIGGVADALVQDGFENLDASGLGSSVNVTGSAGANSLIGSSGSDTINGGAGTDTLDGGAGDDVLNGGDGNDVFLIGNISEYGAGESLDGGAGSDAIRFTSTTPGQTLTFHAGVTGVEGVVIGTAAGLATGTTALDVDASALTSGLSITGNAGTNVLIGTSGNDTLTGGAGNDTLNGGGGINTLSGGTGNDRFMVNSLTDVVSEALNAGTDEVVASLNYTLGANVENLTLTGSANVNGTGNVLANVLTGNSGDNLLSGLAGNDTLDGGSGTDTLIGGSGNDTFDFGLGDGQDLVQDNSGSADKISFDSGINPLDLVISRQADDLRLAIHGSSDQITVQNWYTSSVNRTETIQAGNDQTLLSTQVDQLIQAMAGFTQQTGLSWDAASAGGGTAQQQTQFQGIIAANWQ